MYMSQLLINYSYSCHFSIGINTHACMHDTFDRNNYMNEIDAPDISPF